MSLSSRFADAAESAASVSNVGRDSFERAAIALESLGGTTREGRGFPERISLAAQDIAGVSAVTGGSWFVNAALNLEIAASLSPADATPIERCILACLEGFASALVNTVAPVASGNPYVGETLSVTNGTWTETPDSYTYQWYSDDVAIAGATSNTFVVTASELDTDVTCIVTAIKAGYQDGEAESNALTILWSPSALSLEAWFDANDSDTITESGGFVSQWDDKSGNDNHFLQSVGAAQPQKIGASIFLEQGTPIQALYLTSAITSANVDVFSVRKTNIDTRGIWLCPKTTTNWWIAYYYSTDSSTVINQRNGASVAETFLRNGQDFTQATRIDMYNAMGDDNDCIMEVINTPEIADFPEVLKLSGYNTDGALGDTHYCYEFIIAPTLSTADRQKVEGYLAWKWDAIRGNSVLVDGLAADHPYKSAAP
jgi:hypothetical protein